MRLFYKGGKRTYLLVIKYSLFFEKVKCGEEIEDLRGEGEGGFCLVGEYLGSLVKGFWG